MVTKKIRAFLAVPIPEDLRNRLAALQQALRPDLSDLRWVEPASIHLTLKFLGSIPTSQTSEIVDALRPVIVRREPFTCRVAGIDAIPNRRAAKVRWAGLDPETEALARLAIDLEAALDPLGFPPEKRAFRPHLTLSRSEREGIDVSAVLEHPGFVEASRDLGDLLVDEIVLFRSESGHRGPRYTALASVPLGAAARV